MGIDNARGVQGNAPVDQTATPIDTERRRERRDHRPKKKAATPAAAKPTDDESVTIAPEGAKIDLRA